VRGVRRDLGLLLKDGVDVHLDLLFQLSLEFLDLLRALDALLGRDCSNAIEAVAHACRAQVARPNHAHLVARCELRRHAPDLRQLVARVLAERLQLLLNGLLRRQLDTERELDKPGRLRVHLEARDDLADVVTQLRDHSLEPFPTLAKGALNVKDAHLGCDVDIDAGEQLLGGDELLHLDLIARRKTQHLQPLRRDFHRLVHGVKMADTEAHHAAAMEDLRKAVQQQQQQMGDMQKVVQQQQQMQLTFTTQFGDLFNFMNAVTAEMIEQRNAVKASVIAIKELKDGQAAGYVDAIARRQCAVLREVFAMHERVTALASLVRAGLTEERLVEDGATSRDFQAGEGDAMEADVQSSVEGKHGASRGGDVRAREGDAAVGAAALARLASDTRGAGGPSGSAELGGRVPHESDQSRQCAVRMSGSTRVCRSRESPPWNFEQGGQSGAPLDGLCGILTRGVSYVESMSLSLSISMSDTRCSPLPARKNERRGGRGKFGVFASTRGFHAILVLLLGCTARGDAFAGAATCCATMELRRANGAALLCRDATELRCYDRTALQRSGITGLGASCGDAGSAFWNCFDTMGSIPTPSMTGTSAEREVEPEPSPRWASDGQNENRERATLKRSATNAMSTPITDTTGGGELVLTQQAVRARRVSWRAARHYTVFTDPNRLRRRRLRWHINRRAWKRLMRSLRGNTVADMFNVALWNAREFHAHANPSREASRKKMLWIMRRLQDEDADVCFLLEVMGSHEAFTAE
jgi:hypothetical protein